MKRKDEILEVSLQMFNEEGEANLSAVDIANEMDISPGNLYYHYKGKAEIVEALFERFESSIKTLLQEAVDQEGALEDLIAIYFVLIEQIYCYRFFYRNLSDLIEKYPDINRRFRRLMKLKHTLNITTIQKLLSQEQCDPELVLLGGIENIADNLTLILTYLNEFYSVKGEELDKDTFVQEALNKIIAAIGPYSGKLMALHVNYIQTLFSEH